MPDPGCDPARRILSSLASGEAEPGEAKALDAHLAGCSDCTRHAVAVLRQDRALAEMAGHASLPAMAERLREGLRRPAPRAATTRRNVRPAPSRRPLAWIAVAAAGVLAGVVVLAWPSRPAPPPSTPPDASEALNKARLELARREEDLRKAEEAKRKSEDERRAAQEKLEAVERDLKRAAAERERSEKDAEAARGLADDRRAAEEALARQKEAERLAQAELEKAEAARRKAAADAARPEKPAPQRTVLEVARIEALAFRGDVFIVSEKGRAAAEPGQALSAGQALDVGPESMAVLRFGDETRLDVLEGTTIDGIWEREAGRGRRVQVSKGIVVAEVAKQPAGQPMVFSTPQADAKVLGTVLRVVVDPASTRLDVPEGRVELKRTLDGKSIEVSSGHWAVAAPGTELMSRPFPDDRKKKKKPTLEELKVDAAIQKGVEHLKSYAGAFGGTPRQSRYDELVFLAILHAGLPENDPFFQKLLGGVTTYPLEQTYNVALTAVALEALDRVKYQGRIAHCAQFLVDNQAPNGQWSYGAPTPFLKDVATPPAKRAATPTGGRNPVPFLEREKPKVVNKIPVVKRKDAPEKGDHSNSQYAALGLRACFDAGIVLPREVAVRGRDVLLKTQRADGGWDYEAGAGASYGSMTAGGAGSLAIYDYLLGQPWMKDPAILKGHAWLAQNFTVAENPGIPRDHFGASGDAWQLYFLYALERAGKLYGTAKFGDHDWYAEGMKHLLSTQQPNGSWGAPNDASGNTCWAILFLRRATTALIDVPSEDRVLRKR